MLVTSLLVFASGVPTAAHESYAQRFDPRGDAFIDVWSTRKATEHVARFDHRLWIKVLANVNQDWSVTVFLDTRGGRRADFKLWNIQALGPNTCGGRRLHGPEIVLRCGTVDIDLPGPARLWWRIPRTELRPDKRIRWRIHTHYPGVLTHREDDAAPDTEWYV